MYSVRYQGKGDETDTIEEQFFQIYTENKEKQKMLSTKVRFGQVTGVEFDTTAAAEEVSKSGVLYAAKTLRSFGLVNLHDPTQKFRPEVYAPPTEMVCKRKISLCFLNLGLLKLRQRITDLYHRSYFCF